MMRGGGAGGIRGGSASAVIDTGNTRRWSSCRLRRACSICAKSERGGAGDCGESLPVVGGLKEGRRSVVTTGERFCCDSENRLNPGERRAGEASRIVI